MPNILNFGDEISKLKGTATSSDVLLGKTFFSSDTDILYTGSMPNNGSIINTGTVDVNNINTYTIPAGYHDGTGTSVISGPVLDGNAISTQVLNGSTFYNNSGTKQTGSMTNNGSNGITVTSPGALIPEGYHNGNGVVSLNLTASKTIAAAAQIRSGYSAFDSTGSEIIGSYNPPTSKTITVKLSVEGYNTWKLWVGNSWQNIPKYDQWLSGGNGSVSRNFTISI